MLVATHAEAQRAQRDALTTLKA